MISWRVSDRTINYHTNKNMHAGKTKNTHLIINCANINAVLNTTDANQDKNK